jgi:hypothetical protein
MKINHGVDLVFGANVDHPIQMPEPRLLDDSRVGVVFEMPIIDLRRQLAWLPRHTGIRMQFSPSDEKGIASSSMKKFSRNYAQRQEALHHTLSKKNW